MRELTNPAKGATIKTVLKQALNAISVLGEKLNLEVYKQVEVGRTLWGAKRTIDVVLLLHGYSRKALGIKCKFQSEESNLEEQILSTVRDMSAWPIRGLIVFSEKGLNENIKSLLISTGKAVELSDLEPWLRLYFGLPFLQKGSRKSSKQRISKMEGDRFIIEDDPSDGLSSVSD